MVGVGKDFYVRNICVIHMLAAFTPLKNAEKVKKYIVKKSILHHGFLPVREMGYIYFPLTKRTKIPGAEVVDTKFSLPGKNRPNSMKDLLKDKLTKKKLSLLPRAQEIVGRIMVLEVPKELHSKERIIAEAYLQFNRNVDTVVKKEEMHSGIYRLRKVKILAGKRSKQTVHLENGVRIKLNLEGTYFSARSGNERLRIAKLVKPGEDVLVMFSGAAPYPLVIARNSRAGRIYGIELNRVAHGYAEENVDLNRLSSRIVLKLGDVRQILPKMRRRFDRIVMPLPKTGEEFLDVALPKAKKGAVIHLYSFLDEKEIGGHARKIISLCKRLGYPVKVLGRTKCGQFSPGTFRVCFDVANNNNNNK